MCLYSPILADFHNRPLNLRKNQNLPHKKYQHLRQMEPSNAQEFDSGVFWTITYQILPMDDNRSLSCIRGDLNSHPVFSLNRLGALSLMYVAVQMVRSTTDRKD